METILIGRLGELKEDILTGIGAGISTIFTALSWLWNAGPLQILFSVLTGAFITYFVQTKLERKKIKRETFLEMRDTVYGPLFKAMNQICGALASSRIYRQEEIQSQMRDINTVMNHHLYFIVDNQLRYEIESFYNRIKRYSIIEHAAEGVAKKISEDITKEKLDIQSKRDCKISYRLFVGNELIKSVDLPDAILMAGTPKEILESESAGLVGASIDMVVGGYAYSDLQKLHSACQTAVERAKDDRMFREREAERKFLATKAQVLINRLKAFIG